jgi:hypothetical protein
MKSHRTHTPPPKIEDLGQGEFYYNFNIKKYKPVGIDGKKEKYWEWDYEQVRVSYPVEYNDIKKELKKHNREDVTVEIDE